MRSRIKRIVYHVRGYGKDKLKLIMQKLILNRKITVKI